MFEIIWTKIKGSCQSRRKEVTHNSKGFLTFVPFLPTELEQFEFVRRFSFLTPDTCITETRNYLNNIDLFWGSVLDRRETVQH